MQQEKVECLTEEEIEYLKKKAWLQEKSLANAFTLKGETRRILACWLSDILHGDSLRRRHIQPHQIKILRRLLRI